MEKIKETNKWFFKKISKFEPPTGLTKAKKKKKEREKTDTTHFKNETGDIIKDPAAIAKIMKAYYEQSYTHKFNNLEEMDQFLEIHKVPNTKQNEIDNL